MKKTNTIPTNEKENALLKAKELIASKDLEQQQKAVEIYNEAMKAIDELGYNVIPKGEFVGNQFTSGMILVKKNKD